MDKPEAVAALLDNLCTDEQLADVIHHLTDILDRRLHEKPREGSSIKRMTDIARIEVRSWGTARQQQIERYLYPNRGDAH
jgi:hypothetical protein